MNRQAKFFLGAAAAGLAVAVLPTYLVGPTLQGGDLGLVAMLAGGILTALTPCVYPLIPITVSIFGARSKSSSRGRAAGLSATYVLGIAAMYSSLGLVTAAAGKAFGAYMGNPIVVGIFAVFMLALAASMFGAFELQLPASLQTRLSKVAGLGFGSAFLMGLVAGIVAAPCTGPALSGALAYIATTRDLWTGWSYLFAYAIGMGLPFFVIGTFSVRLPKSGAWMDGVKSILGILLVLVAISYVRPLLPSSPSAPISPLALAVLTGLAVAAAVLAGAINKSFHGGGLEKLVKFTGVVAIVAAVALRFGWVIEPARAEIGVADVNGITAVVPAKIAWIHSESDALALAVAQNKPIIVDFFATWCAACMELDKHTFSDPRVRALVTENFIPLKVDGTDDTDEVRALQQKYGVLGLPVVTVLDSKGMQLSEPRITGFLGADDFLKEIAKVKR